MPKRTPLRPRGRTLAAASDSYDLYQRAVQAPEAEVDFLDETFRKLRRRGAKRIREDFCGTAAISCAWVRRRRTNTAVGLDIDPRPLAWGTARNVAKLSLAQKGRLTLARADVLHQRPGMHGRFDAVLALNFSYWCIKTRKGLLDYFRRVRACLGPDGLLFLDFYGGSDALREIRERRTIGRKGSARSFTYIWDQTRIDPITGDTTCKIHFVFPDGSRLRDAFVYDWRLWTLPEVREVLADAGFARSTVYWEGDDGKGSGNGEFTPAKTAEECPAWVAYIVAAK